MRAWRPDRPFSLFGESVARIRDPEGHLWWLHEHRDVPPEEMAVRFSDPAALEAMAYVQRTLRQELSAANDVPN